MARAKFLCDAERCIECNACVTACKNEHEVPWGINRRRVVTIKMVILASVLFQLHVCIVPMLRVWLYVRWTAFIKMKKVLYYIPRICVLDVDTASTPVHLELRNFLKQEILGLVVKWISVPSVLAVQKRIIRQRSSLNMVVTELQKVNFQFVPKCVLPKRYLQEMAISSLLYIVNE